MIIKTELKVGRDYYYPDLRLLYYFFLIIVLVLFWIRISIIIHYNY